MVQRSHWLFNQKVKVPDLPHNISSQLHAIWNSTRVNGLASAFTLGNTNSGTIMQGSVTGRAVCFIMWFYCYVVKWSNGVEGLKSSNVARMYQAAHSCVINSVVSYFTDQHIFALNAFSQLSFGIPDPIFMVQHWMTLWVRWNSPDSFKKRWSFPFWFSHILQLNRI